MGVTVRRARAAVSEPEFLRISQPAHRGPAARRASASALAYDEQRQQQQQQQQ